MNKAEIKMTCCQIADELNISFEEARALTTCYGAEKTLKLEEVLAKTTLYGFAEIQIDTVALGINEVMLELKQIGLENVFLFLCECEKAEDVPDDWFEDCRMTFLFTSCDDDIADVYAKMKTVKPSYILDINPFKEVCK